MNISQTLTFPVMWMTATSTVIRSAHVNVVNHCDADKHLCFTSDRQQGQVIYSDHVPCQCAMAWHCSGYATTLGKQQCGGGYLGKG